MSIGLNTRRQGRKRRRRPQDGEIHRGTYILPNLFTTANMFCGFFGMVNSIDGHYQTAAVAILASCLFDILDGKVARLVGATSRFGVEYDSLADLVAFGVGPAVLMYMWALKPFGRLGWLAAFLFMACGALRLARFNVQVDAVSKKYFVGLPIPGAACMVSTIVLFASQWKIPYIPEHSVMLLITTYVLGFLMVSNIPYNSLKDLEMLRGKLLPTLFMLLVLIGLPAIYLLIWISLLAAILVVVGYLAALVIPGEGSDFILEIPPLRIPQISNILVKTLARIEWYLKEAVPLFILGTIILFGLHKTKMLILLERAATPLIVYFLGLPAKVTEAFVIGFLRRDYGAAGLFVLAKDGQLNPHQILVSLVTLTLFIPCIAQFFMMIKERGLKKTLWMSAVIFPIAFGVGGMLNFLLKWIGI